MDTNADVQVIVGSKAARLSDEIELERTRSLQEEHDGASEAAHLPAEIEMASILHSEGQDGASETTALLDNQFELSNIAPSIGSIPGNLGPLPKEPDQNTLPRFGSLILFTPWFPEANPEEQRAQTWRTWWSDRRTALAAHQSISVLVLILNLTFTIAAWRELGTTVNGFRTIYEGNCDNARRLNSILHLVINALSTLLLGSSNFCMQLLIAPTRKEVDHAHTQGTWMDIGIPSIRNFWRVKLQRQVGWLLLALSSGTLHLLWNSAVFASTPYITYETSIVAANYFTNDSLSNSSSTTAASSPQLPGRTFQRINTTECIQLYSNPLSGAGDLIVVTTEVAPSNDSALIASFGLGEGNDWSDINLWLCLAYGSACNAHMASFLLEQQPWLVLNTSIPVDYCLTSGVQELGDKCGLNFSAAIMIVVCIMNFIKCICIFYTFRLFFKNTLEGRPLVTIGDAIESFLNQADNGKDGTTRGMCLASQAHFEKKNRSPITQMQWTGQKKSRMFSLGSRTRWIITLGLCSSLLIIGVVLLAISLRTLQWYHLPIDIRSLWGYGLGKVYDTEVIGILRTRTPSQFILAVGFANSWQLEISCLYLLYNALVSNLCAAEEWSHFGKERKFLRVSAPRGMQRSSYFLSLPYRYGIPLSITIGLLHWCISQAVFLVQTAAFSSDGTRNYDDDSSRVGFSSIGMVFSIIAGGVLILGLVGIGWLRKVEFNLPIVSTNSAAFSAAAHCPSEDVDAYLLPVKWGVTEFADGTEHPGHCSLTTARDVVEPKLGSYYA